MWEDVCGVFVVIYQFDIDFGQVEYCFFGCDDDVVVCDKFYFCVQCWVVDCGDYGFCVIGDCIGGFVYDMVVLLVCVGFGKIGVVFEIGIGGEVLFCVGQYYYVYIVVIIEVVEDCCQFFYECDWLGIYGWIVYCYECDVIGDIQMYMGYCGFFLGKLCMVWWVLYC